jgi:type I restriction enzyme S subunit
LSIAKVAQGDTVVHLYPTQIERLDVLVPSPIEQQKIADCLASLDELLTLEAQKLAALKTHKKGLMQQLFPAEGETLPKLRFPEFRDAGEWEEKKLIDAITPVIREVAKPDSIYLALGLRSYGKGTFHKPDQAPEKNSMDKLYLVHHDDLIVNITFAWEGAIAIAGKQDHGCYVSHRFPTYVFKEKVSSSGFFRYVIINKAFVYKLGLISPGGAGRNRVMNKKDFLQLKVLLPDTDEQQKIADCLASLDDLITAQTQKLAALKTHKKGLMQQLFPSPEEIE